MSLGQPERSPGDSAARRKECLSIIRGNFAFVLDRFGKRPDYPWIETKYSVLTGSDFPEDDPVRGLDTVYGWIQGRALEALSTYAQWEEADAGLREKIPEVVQTVQQSLRAARAVNDGHLYFTMTAEGRAFVLSRDGNRTLVEQPGQLPWNFSDLFGVKGLYAAAQWLHDSGGLQEAEEYARLVENSFDRDFQNDQIAFNSGFSQGKKWGWYGPRMIWLTHLRRLMEIHPSREVLERGLSLIEGILHQHTNNRGQLAGIDQGVVFEYTDSEGNPLVCDGKVVANPGHSLEFTGLAQMFLLAARKAGFSEEPRIKAIEQCLPALLKANFSLGFNAGPGGIYNQVDLLSGEKINSKMPWWSLPETMRAALAVARLPEGEVDQEALDIFNISMDAFLHGYVSDGPYRLAVQTLDEKGKPVNFIPAVPAQDPGYHTALSLMDCADLLNADQEEAID
jgi:mannose/cellobiose epimerase-like protein (N-acyl-D-glucosamine 2-epimerase family)